MPYAVRTDVFEGPFDVLLRLITEQRVDLYDVKLAEIVDRFLSELAEMERLDLEVATEFLLIAAILVELKSRRLLPDRSGAVNEEDLALLEERDYLLARLVECTTFSAAGQALSRMEQAFSRSFPRRIGPDDRYRSIERDLLESVEPEDLRAAAWRALSRAPEPRQGVHAEHVLVDEVTVAEVVGRLASVLSSCGSTTFRRLTHDVASRVEAVVYFLGVLELYKQGLVELDQAATFGEIVVTWIGGPGEEVDLTEVEQLSGAERRG